MLHQRHRALFHELQVEVRPRILPIPSIPPTQYAHACLVVVEVRVCIFTERKGTERVPALRFPHILADDEAIYFGIEREVEAHMRVRCVLGEGPRCRIA